ncbi:MAG: hypothetical protein PVG93_03280 [Phycisphaerales bacterium]|jgi:flagellar biosynthesis chaperone FliJ
MKKFVWRLQRVLEVKQRELQSKRTELFEITEHLAVKRTALLAQQRLLQRAIEEVARNKSKEKLAQQELLLKSSRVNDKKIEELKAEVANLQAKQKEKIAEFLKIKRFTEALEKLREKARQEFIAEQEKLEQRETDERTALRFAHRMITAESV